MTVFWVVVALFLAGALMLLLPPLLIPKRSAAHAVTAAGTNLAIYRDQLREAERDLAADTITAQQFAEARAEIERRVLDETRSSSAGSALERPARRTALALALLIPVASILTYLTLGRPDAMTTAAPGGNSVDDPRHATTPDQIQKLVTALAERQRADPGNIEGWVMLARSYTVLGRFRDAAAAFKRANDLAPGNPSLLADYADVLGMVQGKRLSGEPARLIQQALDADARHVKALALAGSVAFEARDYANARAYWERLIAVVPADSDIARSVQGSIEQARQLEGGAGRSATSAAAAKPAVPVAASSIAGSVTISPELAGRVSAGDTVFVFARAAQGPRMPLAVVRRPVAAWPLEFSLDDSMAMAPELKLSSFAQVVIEARISKTGHATPQPGDLTGSSAPLGPGARGVRITIDRVAP